MRSILNVFRSSHRDNMSTSLSASDTAPIVPTDPPTSDPNSQPTSSQPITIIELFQSQGCNSCPPTNANLLSFNGPQTLLLTYHVTYWDYLGWRDTFGNNAFDARQRDYVHTLGLRSAFTPQVVVNGRSSGVGNTAEGLRKVLGEGVRQREGGVSVEVTNSTPGGTQVRVSAREAGGERSEKLFVSLVRYDPEVNEVHIRNGENMGRVLPHRNVVTSVELLGKLSVSTESSWIIRGQMDRLKGVVLVQYGLGGPIIGSALL